MRGRSLARTIGYFDDTYRELFTIERRQCMAKRQARRLMAGLLRADVNARDGYAQKQCGGNRAESLIMFSSHGFSFLTLLTRACFIDGDANEEKNIPRRLKPLVLRASGVVRHEAMPFQNAFLKHALCTGMSQSTIGHKARDTRFQIEKPGIERPDYV
jgi:hypothetical protein